MTILKYLLFLILHICYINNSNALSLNCTISNSLPPSADETISINEGVLTITYDREEVGIYTYNKTDSVNILINDVQVKFDGSLNSKLNSSSFRITPSFPTIIEGIADLSKKGSLENCDLQIEKNIKYSKELSAIQQEKIFYLAKSCIEPKICNDLAKVEEDDYTRAKIVPYEFGDNSVMYNLLGKQFPNFDLPKNVPDSLDLCNNKNLQKSLNIIFDFILASLISKVSGPELGIVELPEMHKVIPGVAIIKDGHFNLTDGTLGNLKNIRRTEDVVISNKGLRFSLQSGFEIPNLKIQYKDNAHYFIFSQNALVTANIDSFKLNIKVSFNYNRSPCKVSVDYLRSTIQGAHSNIEGQGIISRLVGFTATRTVNIFLGYIVDFAKLKLKEAIYSLLESFDCERYRP